jgi:carbonic anhydrase
MKKQPINSAIASLVAGYRRFKSKHFGRLKTYDDLVEQQTPNVLVIACSDSRVDPAIITQAEPGELFVVRNVANLVPPFFERDPIHHGTSAALEFGVLQLGITDIIVFGHSHCGGIRALMESSGETSASSFIAAWMKIASPAKEQVLKQHPQSSPDEQALCCEKASLLISLKNLMTFPWIAKRVRNNELFLHAWYFDLETGVVKAYEPDTDAFQPLDDDSPCATKNTPDTRKK